MRQSRTRNSLEALLASLDAPAVITRWFLACLLCLLSLPAATRGVEPGLVVVVPIKTEISEAQFFFLRRALKEAERQKAAAVVLDMETFGGEIHAAIDSMDALL